MKKQTLTKLLAFTFALSMSVSPVMAAQAEESTQTITAVSGETHCDDFLVNGPVMISFCYETTVEKWTIAKADGGYTFRDEDGMYLTVGSEGISEAMVSSEATVLSIADKDYMIEDGTVYSGYSIALNGTYMNAASEEEYDSTADAGGQDTLFYIYKEITSGNVTLWWKVSNLDDLDANAKYVIISGANGYALNLTQKDVTVVVETEAVETEVIEIEVTTEAETETVVPDTEAPETEIVVESVTEAVTEVETEPVTEAPTEAVTEAAAETEAVTEAPVETEAVTEAPTEAPTEAATEAETTVAVDLVIGD